MPENWKNAPSRNSCRGEAIPLTLCTVFSRTYGRRIFAASASTPSTEAMTSGFFAIWPRMCSGFGFWPRNTSSTMMDIMLKIGTMIAIRIETVPS